MSASTPRADASGLVAYGSPAGRWIVGSTVLGSGIAAIDATVVGIALPSIGRQLHASFGALQWVVTGYTMTLAALLLLGGALGDAFGRRRVFTIGVIWFTATSAVCALSPNVSVLIVMRVLQGVGGALLTPGSLAIIEASFVPDDRGRAIGAWSGLGGVATAAGPLLGGYLIAAASWRWIFVINLPIGAAVVWIARRHVPESRDPDAGRPLDLLGAALAVLALASITYALIEGPTAGATPAVVTLGVLGVLAAASLVAVERRATNPMLPASAFRVRQFSVTNAVTFVVYAALGGALFLLPVELQVVDGFSPLAAGASLLPVTVLMLALSAGSGQLAGRLGPRLQMSVGPLGVGAGLVLLSRTATDASYVTGVLPGVLVLGLGLATTVAPLTTTALSSLPARHAGLASAVNNDVARLGSLVAVAVLPAVAGITGTAYLHPHALGHGFRTAVAIAAIACVAAAALAAAGIRNPPRTTAEPRIDPPYHCALEGAPLATRPAPAPA